MDRRTIDRSTTNVTNSIRPIYAPHTQPTVVAPVTRIEMPKQHAPIPTPAGPVPAGYVPVLTIYGQTDQAGPSVGAAVTIPLG